ncbi:MAG: CvpA family protein [Candidatus Kerfeldbacteria bacterium]|nr:CvpA family protein [Candidatus Kerfeldbacteria bacterium]
MNWLDIILIIWLASSALSGFKLGFFYKVTSLVATLFGLYLTTKYTSTVASWFGSGVWSLITTFLVLVTLVSHVAGMLALGVDRMFSVAKWIPFVGLANRIAGAIVSLILSCIILSVVFWLASTFADNNHMVDVINNSFLARNINHFSLLFLPLIAQTLKDKVLNP